MLQRFTISLLLLFSITTSVFAQNELLNELEHNDESTAYALQTFKGTRIVNGQSVETKGKGELEFIFSHRFGRVNSGSYNFWGLDDAFVRLGLEYGITDRLGVSIGRTSVDKTFDSFLRYKLVRQRQEGGFPLTVTAIGTGYVLTSPRAKDNPQISMNERMAYSLSLLLARRINSSLSVQLTPVFVHRNSVSATTENNDDLSLGAGGRCKVTRSVSLTAEYYYRLNPNQNAVNFDALGFGVDIETGGHVFQLVFTNSLGMFDRAIVAETGGDFFDGDIHFGFNITRSFQLSKRK